LIFIINIEQLYRITMSAKTEEKKESNTKLLDIFQERTCMCSIQKNQYVIDFSVGLFPVAINIPPQLGKCEVSLTDHYRNHDYHVGYTSKFGQFLISDIDKTVLESIQKRVKNILGEVSNNWDKDYGETYMYFTVKFCDVDRINTIFDAVKTTEERGYKLFNNVSYSTTDKKLNIEIRSLGRNALLCDGENYSARFCT
jgi:hypothetical protein